MEDAALKAARELLPIITELRGETEARRCIAEPIVERLRDSRLGRLALGPDLHGLELWPVGVLDVLEVLAGAEASVSWIVWNNLLPCLFGRYLADSARAEVFGDARSLYASSTRPSGRASVEAGGYRVHGRWSLVSGCELADWIALLCAIEQDGEPRMREPGVPELRFMFVRRDDCEILDTWHTGGLRGTGSHDVVVADHHVPQRWSASPGDRVQIDGPFGRLPIISTMGAGYAAQLLGIAAVALETLIGLTRTKVSPDPGPGLGERPPVLAAIARHAAGIAAARAHLRSCATELWELARSGGPTLDGITSLHTAAHHAVDQARSAIESMYAAGGTTSLYTSCPLERAHRDVHAMSRHIVAQPLWLEDAGRVKLGKPPTHPLYAV